MKCAGVVNLAAKDAKPCGITLTWQPGKDTMSGYLVKRATLTSDFLQVSDALDKNTLTFTDFGVLPGKLYHYQVYAIDILGNLSDPVLVDYTAPKRTQ